MAKDTSKKRVLITRTAGFIGFHLAKPLLAEGIVVFGFDGMTDYYDVALKKRRHQMLLQDPNFAATEGMLEDRALFEPVANEFEPDVIIHLAAHAGVRYSLKDPRADLDSNVIGTFNVMEARAPSKCAAPTDGLDLIGLWRKHRNALHQDRNGRHAADNLRCNQEGEREHGLCLCA